MKVTSIKMPLKVYISIDNDNNLFNIDIPKVARWINGGNIKLVFKLEDADILLLPSGPPVDPKNYGQRCSQHIMGTSPSRDRVEMNMIKECEKKGVFVVGIGRGAHLCTAYNNGKIVQNVSHHYSVHPIKDSKTGKTYRVNTSHYQMMFPYNLKETSFEIIAFVTKPMITGIKFSYKNGDDEETLYKGVPCKFLTNFKDPEIVYYPRTGCFACQINPDVLHQANTEEFLTYLNTEMLTRYAQYNEAYVTKQQLKNEKKNRNSRVGNE